MANIVICVYLVGLFFLSLSYQGPFLPIYIQVICVCVSMNVCKYEFVLVCLCVSANVLLLKSIQSFASKSQLKDSQRKVRG